MFLSAEIRGAQPTLGLSAKMFGTLSEIEKWRRWRKGARPHPGLLPGEKGARPPVFGNIFGERNRVINRQPGLEGAISLKLENGTVGAKGARFPQASGEAGGLSVERFSRAAGCRRSTAGETPAATAET